MRNLPKVIPGYKIVDGVKFWILENLVYGSIILELGSGEGTSELAEYYEMYSIEHDPKWCGLFDSKYIYTPIKDKYYAINKQHLPSKYDLLLIDGPQSPHKRSKFLQHIDKFDLSVILVIDDTNRSDEMYLATELGKITERPLKIYQDRNKSFGVIWKV